MSPFLSNVPLIISKAAHSFHIQSIEKKLVGKVAVVTGGASGIGACTAHLFCRHGANVVIADVQDELGRSVCGELGPAASYIHCNVTDEDHVRRTVDHAVNKFGRLDIMFNNAGIVGPYKQSIIDDSKKDFERVIAVNLLGPFLGTKHAARVMIPVGTGSIITTSSITSITAGISPHAYTCSKHAVVGLTRNAAAELGRHGVRVNCVSPATVVTPLASEFFGISGKEIEKAVEEKGNLRGKGGVKVEDVAKAVLFLSSDDARFISGHNLVVDGGITIVNPNFDFF